MSDAIFNTYLDFFYLRQNLVEPPLPSIRLWNEVTPSFRQPRDFSSDGPVEFIKVSRSISGFWSCKKNRAGVSEGVCMLHTGIKDEKKVQFREALLMFVSHIVWIVIWIFGMSKAEFS